MNRFRFESVEDTSGPRNGLADTPANWLLRAIFDWRFCTVCEYKGPGLVYVIRVDETGDRWDGSTVCAGETECATIAMARYAEAGDEPWPIMLGDVR